MNEEQQELLDEAYENYSKEYEKDNSIGMCLLVKRLDGKSTYRKPNKEMFVDLCTYDKTFSERWGLKIEERELSLEDRHYILTKTKLLIPISDDVKDNWIETLNEKNIPTKLITITYNDKTIESYES
jgi:hypothetical protein